MSALDLSGIEAGLARMLGLVDEAVRDGLDAAAPGVQETLQSTTAHGDMSGATRASYRAIPIGPDRDGSAAAASGYAAAAEHLSGYTGHGGHPFIGDSGVTLGRDQRGMILTGFTDYLLDLVTENAGEKDAIAPVLQQSGQDITRQIAEASRSKLK